MKRHSRTRFSVRFAATALLMSAGAGWLVTTAWPMTTAHYQAWLAEKTPDVGAALALLSSAAARYESPDILQRMMERYLQLAERSGLRTPTGKSYLVWARRHAIALLSRQPSHGLAWLALAEVEWHVREDAAAAARLVELSILSEPFEPSLLIRRLDLVLQVLPNGTEQLRSMADRQVRFGWERSWRAVVGLAKTHGPAVIQLALSNDPSARAKLDAALATPPGR